MQVGVTTLKKVCRMHNIKRWPYRRRSYIHKLTRKAGCGEGRASANERAAERAREASGALGPAALHLPVCACWCIPCAWVWVAHLAADGHLSPQTRPAVVHLMLQHRASSA